MKGFTLIEIIVVVTIFSVLVTLGLFMSMETFRGTLYRSEKDTIVSLLQKARSRAMSNINQTSWGVCYRAPNYVIIKDVVCDAAHTQDTIAAHAGVAAVSNFTTTFPVVVFAQLSGTATPATITVRQDNRSATIVVNNEGTINW